MTLNKVFLSLFFIIIFIYGQKVLGQTNSQPVTDSLTIYRNQIDQLDNQVIQLLGKRMLIVEKIGAYKKEHNIPVLQQQRFDAILQKNILLGKNVNLSFEFITDLMNAIHKESLKKENEIQ